jgi:transposase
MASNVTRHFGCNEQTIYRLQQRVRQTGSVNDRPRSGRLCITTPREDRYIVTSSRVTA